MDETKMVLGMDIGGTYIRSAFVDAKHKLEEFRIDKTAEVLSGDNIPDKLAEYTANLLNAKKMSPLAIVMGLPSTVDRDNRFVYSTPNIQGLNNIDIAACVEKVCTIPVYVNRDVNLILLYDIYDNNLKNEGFILGFYIGTGFGNAISLNGRIVVGKHGVSGELGHIPMLGKKDPCGCGSLGCLELYASGKRLAEIHDTHFNGMPFDSIFENNSEHPVVTEFIENIAMGIASEITILDPDEVILGGGVVVQKSFPRKKLEAAIRNYTRKPYPADNLHFIYSKESNKNGVIGAGIFGFQKIGLKDTKKGAAIAAPLPD